MPERFAQRRRDDAEADLLRDQPGASPNYFYKLVLRVKYSGSTVSDARAIGFWMEHKAYTGDSYVNLPDQIESSAESGNEEDKKFVKEKVGNHYRLTKSARGKMINDDFNNNVAKFKKVIPKDYKEVMEFVREKEVEGLNREEALAFAFNAKVGIN